MFADDANTIISKDFWTAGFRAGFSWLKRGQVFEPYFGINNIFSAKYNANIIVNAAANRFFEPATAAFFFTGLRWRWQER
ncbi:MAG: hypothetical protein HC790_10480 [Acaryochloridaceae cyanobacterium CSU_3_4]|nr:hypothetical protein [Acaryochloridaceae cyanobacterium CSU_3_4]